jgi:hypothetical protein
MRIANLTNRPWVAQGYKRRSSAMRLFILVSMIVSSLNGYAIVVAPVSSHDGGVVESAQVAPIATPVVQQPIPVEKTSIIAKIIKAASDCTNVERKEVKPDSLISSSLTK